MAAEIHNQSINAISLSIVDNVRVEGVVEVWIRPSWYYLRQGEEAMPFPVPGWMWDRSLGQKLYGDSMRFVRRVDELGFDGLLFTEHHYSPNGGLTPSPLVLLAAATQITERIKLVTMGIQLALYPHPVRAAEELAMVDNLSGGRLVAGFVSATAPNLYAYNLSAGDERERYHEAYDLLVKAWTEENPFEWHSEHYDYQCVSILPRPLQVPHPPVWTVAASAESLQWAAHRHMGLMTSGPVTQATETLDTIGPMLRLNVVGLLRRRTSGLPASSSSGPLWPGSKRRSTGLPSEEGRRPSPESPKLRSWRPSAGRHPASGHTATEPSSPPPGPGAPPGRWRAEGSSWETRTPSPSKSCSSRRPPEPASWRFAPSSGG